jgi:aquaporin Z
VEGSSRSASIPWLVLRAELVGTAALVLVGLSLVIVMFGEGSPIPAGLPSEGWRRLITGFLFGTTGALIALSPVGKRSGAHINPIVTLAFRLMGKLDLRTSLGYVGAQLAGAYWGACASGLGRDGEKRHVRRDPAGRRLFRRGSPARGSDHDVHMVTLLCVFLSFRRIRPFTPAIFPILYAVMVYAESPISGTSTNPARTLGPAVISGHWDGWWIYWVGPVIGSVAACVACSALAKRITVAKLYHFDSDRDRLFRRTSGQIA